METRRKITAEDLLRMRFPSEPRLAPDGSAVAFVLTEIDPEKNRYVSHLWLVPVRADHPGVYENRIAIEKLKTLTVPVLLPWATEDPITASGEQVLRSIFRNVAPPLPIAGAGHFLQDDAGELIAEHIVRWAERRQSLENVDR